MQYYPNFALSDIYNMTLTEWRQRIKAHHLSIIEMEGIFYQLPFIQRAVNASDKDGNYLYKDLKDVGIDLEAQRKQITGEAREKVNKYVELSKRAKMARELALKQFKKGG